MSKDVKHNSTISDQVLDQIKEGQVHMHPDWYFALLTSGFAIAVASILAVAIYAVNLALLRMEIAEEGMRPWLMGRYYLDSRHMPLGFVLIAIVAIAGVVYLLRHRSKYARALPEWSIVLGVVVFTACLGLALSRSPINHGLRHTGPFRPLYEDQQPMPRRPLNFNERNQQPAL